MTTALATIGGLLGNQSRRISAVRPEVPSAIAVVGTSKDAKTSKRISRQAREERLWALLTQPEVIGYMMAIGGLVAVNNIPFSGNEEKNAYLQGLASTMSVLMGLGYAGVGDLASLSIALMAGGGSLFSNIMGSSGDIGEWYRYVNPIGWAISEWT